MIPIQNIYYMLSYAYKILSEQEYKSLAAEPFNNVADLCAAILSKGVASLLKRGLGREYLNKTETLSTPRGQLKISDSIKTKSLRNRQLVCSYDDFSVNTYLNQILKTTMMLLLRADIPLKRKKQLRKLLIYLKDVDTLDIHRINWNQKYNRVNKTYQMLVSICYLVVKGLLQTREDGSIYLMDYLDEQRMSRLYEKFILEYFRREFPQISSNASQIPWALDNDMSAMLPVMQTDVTLTYDKKVLIIDAKYYSHTTQSYYGSYTLHSNNLYQIFTYVKNKEAALSNEEHDVSGMLLYARTDEAVQPDNTYYMSGNKISARTLDLNCDFKEIAIQLDKIIEEHFGISPK